MDSSGPSLIINNKNAACTRYMIETKSEETAKNLSKLSTGDSITASGFLDNESCNAVIQSVDYVGLKKLIGSWYSSEGLIVVHSHNTLTFYTAHGDTFPAQPTLSSIITTEYRYSLTPSDGQDWVLFLSDNSKTIFATIRLIKGIAILKFYDSETGQATKTLTLSKK